MKKLILLIFILILLCSLSLMSNDFERFSFLLGKWKGTGSGFGNETSIIKSSFELVMDGKYIVVKNDSRFKATKKRPKGEHHTDWGMISFDKSRKKIVFRQFNSEGYVNRYILNDKISSKEKFVFETEEIENFVPGGKARWTILKTENKSLKTIFDVAFPGKKFACFGTNKLKKMKGHNRKEKD